MRLFGVIGDDEAGRSRVLERLAEEITGRGLTVSVVRSVSADFDLDRAGKDSFRHRAAGASEVVLSSRKRFALMQEQKAGGQLVLADLLARLAPVDLVLVEGFDNEPHPKIEIRKAGAPVMAPDDPSIRAVASLEADVHRDRPVLDPGDARAMADFVLTEARI